MFVQYNGELTPAVTALYFDRNAGAGTSTTMEHWIRRQTTAGTAARASALRTRIRMAAGEWTSQPGLAYVDDDGNGICDYRSSNVGTPCTVNANCLGGNCLTVDETDELCGRVCAAGTASGRCSASASNAGSTSHVGSATCPGAHLRCRSIVPESSDCGTGGNCHGRVHEWIKFGAACTALSQCPGGYCKGSQAAMITAPTSMNQAETCPVYAGKLAVGDRRQLRVREQSHLCSDEHPVFEAADVIVQTSPLSTRRHTGMGTGMDSRTTTSW